MCQYLSSSVFSITRKEGGNKTDNFTGTVMVKFKTIETTMKTTLACVKSPSHV